MRTVIESPGLAVALAIAVLAIGLPATIVYVRARRRGNELDYQWNTRLARFDHAAAVFDRCGRERRVLSLAAAAPEPNDGYDDLPDRGISALYEAHTALRSTRERVSAAADVLDAESLGGFSRTVDAAASALARAEELRTQLADELLPLADAQAARWREILRLCNSASDQLAEIDESLISLRYTSTHLRDTAAVLPHRLGEQEARLAEVSAAVQQLRQAGVAAGTALAESLAEIPAEVSAVREKIRAASSAQLRPGDRDAVLQVHRAERSIALVARRIDAVSHRCQEAQRASADLDVQRAALAVALDNARATPAADQMAVQSAEAALMASTAPEGIATPLHTTAQLESALRRLVALPTYGDRGGVLSPELRAAFDGLVAAARDMTVFAETLAASWNNPAGDRVRSRTVEARTRLSEAGRQAEVNLEVAADNVDRARDAAAQAFGQARDHATRAMRYGHRLAERLSRGSRFV